MLSECGCCQKMVEEVDGEFICDCGTKWRMGAGRKRSLSKKRPSWRVRNAEKVKVSLLVLSVVVVMTAAAALVSETIIVGL